MAIRLDRSIPWLCAVLFASACADTTPEQTATPSADPAPINDVRERYIAAFNAGDAAAIAALYADDAVALPDHRPALEGREAIRKDLEQIFSQYTTSMSLTPADTEVVGDFAHEHGTYSVTLTPKAGGDAMMETGKYLVLLKRDADGTWKVHHDIDNTNSPPPGAPAQPTQGAETSAR